MFPFKLTPKRIEYLKELELDSPFDVVKYFPRTYNTYNLTQTLDNNMHDSRVVVKGIVKRKERPVRFGGHKTIFKFRISYDYEEYTVVVFNRDYLYHQLIQGEEVLVVGRYNNLKKEINLIELVTKGIDKLSIKPIYRLPAGITNYEFQLLLKLCFDDVISHNQLNEIVPVSLINKYRLVNRLKAYTDVHFPKDFDTLKQALRYLKYEELLIYSLSFQLLRKDAKKGSSKAKKDVDINFVNKVKESCGFTLTDDQENSVKEIIDDLEKESLMYRMLQGDVGSGKTLVAALACAASYSASYQSVLMAPTDILARQHYDFVSKLLKPFNVNVVLLVSSMSVPEKRHVLESIENGSANIIIGTHALIQKGVNYYKLGLAVVDEQHRFGVKQKQELKLKGEDVELLMMSATPIPRTLAITLYGDMDISTLHSFPTTKRDVKTKVLNTDTIKPILKDIESTVNKGDKVFIVCPLIEESEDRRNVIDVYNGLSKYFAGKIKVGIVHGKMDDSEKESTMLAFKNGDISIIVATTVIEVGIDVKNASMMIIYDAESFGLATLHQLRGRIGRNGQPSTCYLLCANGEENAMNRLNYLVDHDDGFDIARFDLASRGPGDIGGVRQSGIPDLNIANIYDDLKILEVARDDAKWIIENKDIEENKQIIAYLTRI